MKVVLFDEWAEGGHVKLQNRLQVYCAKMLAGKEDRRNEVTVWVYNESYVHVVEEDCELLPFGKEVKPMVR